MKKRLAIWTPGGVGAGIYSQGFPFIGKLLERFSDQYEVDVYTLTPPNKDFQQRRYKVLSSFKGRFHRIAHLYLIFIFIKSHFRSRYNLLYSFWGYPTGFIVVVVGKVFNIPSVVNILGGESANLPQINYGLLRNKLMRSIIIWTCNNANQLIALTQYQVDVLQKYGLIRNTEIIPWGPDSSLFKFSKKEPTNWFNIVHVANLNAVKDQQTLIKCFNLVSERRNARLRIIGPDFLDGKIQNLVNELGIQDRVEFMGAIPYHEMPEHYQWAHVIILTSLSEGQNNSLLEAAASGVLMVGTRVGIIYDLGDRFCVNSDIGDYEDLANKLLTILNNDEEREMKIMNAYKWTIEHDFEWSVKQLLNVINGTLR